MSLPRFCGGGLQVRTSSYRCSTLPRLPLGKGAEVAYRSEAPSAGKGLREVKIILVFGPHGNQQYFKGRDRSSRISPRDRYGERNRSHQLGCHKVSDLCMQDQETRSCGVLQRHYHIIVSERRIYTLCKASHRYPRCPNSELIMYCCPWHTLLMLSFRGLQSCSVRCCPRTTQP